MLHISLYVPALTPLLIQAYFFSPQSSSLLLFCPECSYRFRWADRPHMDLISVPWSLHKRLRTGRLSLRDTLDPLQQMPVKMESSSSLLSPNQPANTSLDPLIDEKRKQGQSLKLQPCISRNVACQFTNSALTSISSLPR